jgi:hypothetical protein
MVVRPVAGFVSSPCRFVPFTFRPQHGRHPKIGRTHFGGITMQVYEVKMHSLSGDFYLYVNITKIEELLSLDKNKLLSLEKNKIF